VKKTLAILATSIFVGSILLPSYGQADDKVSGIRAIGARSCDAWAKDREDEFSWPAIANRNWFVGFISGIAIGANNDFLRGVDIPPLVAWMDNYCAENPRKFADDAVIILARKLVNKEQLPKPPVKSSTPAY